MTAARRSSSRRRSPGPVTYVVTGQGFERRIMWHHPASVPVWVCKSPIAAENKRRETMLWLSRHRSMFRAVVEHRNNLWVVAVTGQVVRPRHDEVPWPPRVVEPPERVAAGQAVK